MDTGELYARIAQMRDSAGVLGRSTARIADCLQAIDSEITALTADRFMSIGAEAFRVEYTRLKPRLFEAFDQLHRFQDKLNMSADEIEIAARTTK
jgi:uncharacterized protein YukE